MIYLQKPDNNKMNRFILSYIEEIKITLEGLEKEKINEVIEIIFKAYKSGRQLFVMGNGGSASTSSHFACDIGKGTSVRGKKRFRVISLNDNIALLTALSNDYGYEYVFSEQLKNLVNEEDIIIAFSASGNSLNIVNGVKYAREKGAFVISFVGFDGGILREISNLCVHVGNFNYGQIEDTHMLLCHLISQAIKKKIEEELDY